MVENPEQLENRAVAAEPEQEETFAQISRDCFSQDADKTRSGGGGGGGGNGTGYTESWGERGGGGGGGGPNDRPGQRRRSGGGGGSGDSESWGESGGGGGGGGPNDRPGGQRKEGAGLSRAEKSAGPRLPDFEILDQESITHKAQDRNANLMEGSDTSSKKGTDSPREKPLDDEKSRPDSIKDLLKSLEEADKKYQKDLEAWKPENYGKKLAADIKDKGLDRDTVDGLRARAANGDLDKVLDEINKDPELKNAGISLKKSADGKSIILSENGKEKQKEHISGNDSHGRMSLAEQSTPEKEAKMDKTADEIADEIIKNGGLTDKAKEALRKEQMNGFYNKETGQVSAGLLDRINQRLAKEGLKIEESEKHLQTTPEKPVFPGTPTIGGETWSTQVELNLKGKDGQTLGSVYAGNRHYQRPYY